MKESFSLLLTGIVIHFGSTFLYILSLYFIDITFFNVIMSFLINGLIFAMITLFLERVYPVVEITLS